MWLGSAKKWVLITGGAVVTFPAATGLSRQCPENDFLAPAYQRRLKAFFHPIPPDVTVGASDYGVQHFTDIIAQIPEDLPRVHHGRSLTTGCDCVGLPLAVYCAAGWPLDEADMPYTEEEADILNAHGTIEKQVSGRLLDVTTHVRMAMDHDGDIWIFSIGDGLRHAGVYANGLVVHMADRLYRREADKVRPHLKHAYRIPREMRLF